MKIPGFRDDAGIAGVASHSLADLARRWFGAAGTAGFWPPDFIGIGERNRHQRISDAERQKPVAAINELSRNHMNDVLVPLDHAVDQHQPAAHDHLAVALKHFRPDHHIGNAGLVLERHEHHPLGGSRPLADQHKASDLDTGSVLQ